MDGVLDLLFVEMYPFAVEGIKLCLWGGLSHSPHKDGEGRLSLTAWELQFDQIALSQKTMLWVEIFQVIGASSCDLASVISCSLFRLPRSSEVVDISQTSKIVACLSELVYVVRLGKIKCLVLPMLIVPKFQLLANVG